MSETTKQRTDRLMSMSRAELVMHAQDLTRQRDELLAALERMNRAYVNLMESARDRIVMLGGECDSVDVMEQNDHALREARTAITSVKGGEK